jgi:hypothetical protein
LRAARRANGCCKTRCTSISRIRCDGVDGEFLMPTERERE